LSAIPGQRATDSEISDRVSKVYMLLLNGLKRRNILQYATEKGWDVEIRQVDRYIDRASNLLENEAKENIKHAYSMSLNRHDDLYFKSAKINDFKTCLAIQKSRDELTGVRTNKLELTGKDGTALNPVVPAIVMSEDTMRQIGDILAAAKAAKSKEKKV